MTRYLVTGGTGFIGSHLVDELLDRGHEVTCLARPSARSEQMRVRPIRLIEGNLLDADRVASAVKGCDVVFHLAGLVKALKSETMHRTNVEGTRLLAAACAARSSPPALVMTSSLAAAGPSSNGQPRREVDHCQPVSVYGRSKRGAEMAATEFADRVPVTIVRPPIVFGPRDQGMLPLFKAIRRTRVHMLPGYRRRWYSLIHSTDLIEALILAAEKGLRIDPAAEEGYAQGCYFAADDQQVTYGQLGSLIARSLGGRFAVNLPMPKWSVWMTAFVNDRISRRRGEPHIFNIDKAREATAGNWTCSSEKIQKELGFQTGAPLSDRLQETGQWYREQRFL